MCSQHTINKNVGSVLIDSAFIFIFFLHNQCWLFLCVTLHYYSDRSKLQLVDNRNVVCDLSIVCRNTNCLLFIGCSDDFFLFVYSLFWIKPINDASIIDIISGSMCIFAHFFKLLENFSRFLALETRSSWVERNKKQMFWRFWSWFQWVTLRVVGFFEFFLKQTIFTLIHQMFSLRLKDFIIYFPLSPKNHLNQSFYQSKSSFLCIITQKFVNICWLGQKRSNYWCSYTYLKYKLTYRRQFNACGLKTSYVSHILSAYENKHRPFSALK